MYCYLTYLTSVMQVLSAEIQFFFSCIFGWICSHSFSLFLFCFEAIPNKFCENHELYIKIIEELVKSVIFLVILT